MRETLIVILNEREGSAAVMENTVKCHPERQRRIYYRGEDTVKHDLIKIILLKAQKSFSHLGYTPCSARSFLHFIHSPVRHFRPAAPDSREKSKT